MDNNNKKDKDDDDDKKELQRERGLSVTPPPIPVRPLPSELNQMKHNTKSMNSISLSNKTTPSSSSPKKRSKDNVPTWKKKLNRLGRVKKNTETKIDLQRNSDRFDQHIGVRTMPVSSEELRATGKLKIFQVRGRYDSQADLHTLPDIGDSKTLDDRSSGIVKLKKRPYGMRKVHQTAELITDVLDVARVSHLRYDEQTGMHIGQNVPKELLKMLNQKFALPFRLYHKKHVDGYNSKIPAVLIQLKNGLIERNGFLQEGIFRLAAETNEINSVKDELNSGTFQGTQDVNIYSTLIKVWYRLLPRRILDAVNIRDIQTTAEAQELIDTIPEPERSCFEWLLDLCCEVVLHRDTNKMNAKNLAIVIAPNLYAPPQITGISMTEQLRTVETLKHYTKFIELCIRLRMDAYYGGQDAKA